MSVELTSRGFKAILATLLMIAFGLALRDFILIGVPLVFILFLYTQYRKLRDDLGRLREVLFSPDRVEDNVTAGSKYSGPIRVNSPLVHLLELVSMSNYESYEPGMVGSGEVLVSFSFSPILSGIHESEVRGCIQDNYRLLKASGELDFRAVFNVYPRVFPVAIAAIQYLIGAGSLGEMTADTTKLGRGGDYAYTRRYEPGDPLNLFDWKAYARTGKPMVKEYYEEAGGGVNIVYDPLALDRVSVDELNSEFLKTVLTYAQAKIPIQLHKLEKKGVKQVASNQMDSLKVALQISLEYVFEDFFEYYAVLEPIRVDKVRKMFGVQNPEPFNVGLLNGEVIMVSSLQGNPAKIIDIIKKVPHANIRIIQPTRKWLYTQDLNKAVRIYLDNKAKMRILEKVGVKTYEGIIEAEPFMIETN